MNDVDHVVAPDGTRIGFRRIGRGRPLVLVHGTSSNHLRWLGLADRLSRGRQLVVMDRRGRGMSGDAQTYDIAREFEDVAAVVAAAGTEVDLLGHSFGALCAIEAARLTGAIRRMILYEPAFGIEGYPIYEDDAEAVLSRLLVEEGPEAMLLAFLTDVVGMTSESVDAMRRDASSWAGRVDAAPTVLREMVDGSYPFRPARYSTLKMPCLLLMGSESAPALRVGCERLSEVLPGARLHEFAGQGHVAMLTAPDMFCTSVENFLDA